MRFLLAILALILCLGTARPEGEKRVFLRCEWPPAPVWDTVVRVGATGCLNSAQKADLPAVEEVSDIALPRRLAALMPRVQKGEITLILIADRPPPGRLGFVALAGPGIPAETLVTSPTTRTPRLIAAIDLTPAGRPIQFLPEARDAVREALDFEGRVAATEAAKTPVLATYGALAGAAVLLAVVALAYSPLAQAAIFGLVLATAGTLATLSPWPSLLVFFAVSVGVASLTRAPLLWRARAWGVRPLLGLLVAVIVIDAIFRIGLVAHSPLSGYYLAGIRYYGIGNEYMGLLIGAALMGLPARFLTLGGIFTVLVLGLPFWGANVGGAMAATVALPRLVPRHPLSRFSAFRGERGGWWGALATFGAALVVAALLGLVDRLLPEVVQSHIGQAAGKGPAAWGEIIGRKIAMNARIALMPATLIALAGVAFVGGLLARASVGARVRETVAGDPDLAGRVRAGLWGALAALIFNDSGIVAALLLLAPVTVTVIETTLCATSPSTTAPNASD